MTDYEKLYRIMAESVDAFFELLKQEKAYEAVATLANARLYCMDQEECGAGELS